MRACVRVGGSKRGVSVCRRRLGCGLCPSWRAAGGGGKQGWERETGGVLGSWWMMDGKGREGKGRDGTH